MMEGKMGLLLLATAFCAVFFSPALGTKTGVPAIYVFGDSGADVGNNNYLPGEHGKVNFPHNGIDYPGGKPTGRFSNGYNFVDLLAMKLGFKMSPPAYLSITSDAQIYEGVNFASGGSGVLDSTGQIFISLNTQIQYFEAITRRLKTRTGAAAADLILSKSLFVLSTGTNDIFSYFTSGLQNTTQGDQFIRLIASQFRNQLQTLYTLGARKFAVFSPSKIGCVPLVRRITPSGDCIEVLNEFSRQFNEAIKLLLHDFSSTTKGTSYAFVDAYEILTAVSSEPSKYGFKELISACCGSGRFNAESSCTPNATYCSNRQDHLFWDQSHATQALSEVLATAAYHGGRRFVVPVNVAQLAKS